MAHHGHRVQIEEMFADIPNTAYHTSTSHIERLTMPIHKTETRHNSLPQLKLQRASTAKTAKSASATGSHQGHSSHHHRISLSSVDTATSTSRDSDTHKSGGIKSAIRRKLTGQNSIISATRQSQSSHTTKSDVKSMTSATAMAMYSGQLTKPEHTEIMNYQFVYYLGSTAKKIHKEPGTAISKLNNGYDDDEHFYNIVPKDHIAYRFEVAEKPHLGKGTFGQVVKAYDYKEQRWVALKMVRNEKIYLNQSKEELRILQVLRKQDTNGLFNVVKLFDFFMFRNHMVFSFELLGMNLYQVLKRNSYRGLSTARILPIARGVAKCLELLFKNRIVHCDIKPENIMLRKNGDLTSVKVGDFGSSCYEQQQKYHYIQSRYYRAPEVMLGLRYGPAIDMWSFGCVLAELCKGSPIMVGDDEADQLAAVKEVLGEVPDSLLNKSKMSDSRLVSKNKSRGRPGSKSLRDVLDGDEHFKDCVKKILVWDPDLRPSPVEIQQHPWMASTRARRTVIRKSSQTTTQQPIPRSTQQAAQSVTSNTTTTTAAAATSAKGKKLITPS